MSDTPGLGGTAVPGYAGSGPRATSGRGGSTLLAAGIALMIAAAVGWIGTSLVSSFAASDNAGREDLTAQFQAAGDTLLGQSTTVTVQPGQTAVAYLVGTGLHGTAGTTTGDCSALDANGAVLDVSDSIHIDTGLTGVLAPGQELVAIAGVQPEGAAVLTVTCDSRDSGVDHYVVVASNRATITSTPSWSPWAWVLGGLLGVALIGIGYARLPSVPDDVETSTLVGS